MTTYAGRVKRLVAALVAAPMLTLAGCGVVSFGPPSVSASELERVLSERLPKEQGLNPQRVECPEGLESAKNSTSRCMIDIGPATYGVTVTSTGIIRGLVLFDIEVDEQPTGS